MSNPKISVIIIYRNEENLYDCVQSALQQSFSNIEIICVNNASKDNAEEIVKNIAQNADRIKMISMPVENEDIYVKRAGLSIALGEFVFFVENNEILEPDYVKNLYLNAQKEHNIEIKNNYLYRRTFLENDREINELVKFRVEEELKKYSGFIQEQKHYLQAEIDKINQNIVENIKNNSYEIISRFNALEKQFYNKDYEYKITINNAIEEQNRNNDAINSKLYEEIAKIYNYINDEMNKKGSEIHNIYEEITKNYNYTEKLVEDRQNAAITGVNSVKNEIWQKINDTDKNIIFRYVNLKRLMDAQIDEINSKLQTLKDEK